MHVTRYSQGLKHVPCLHSVENVCARDTCSYRILCFTEQSHQQLLLVLLRWIGGGTKATLENLGERSKFIGAI